MTDYGSTAQIDRLRSLVFEEQAVIDAQWRKPVGRQQNPCKRFVRHVDDDTFEAKRAEDLYNKSCRR